MREALGLAPKRSTHPQGNRLDKHEFSELVKRGSTAEDLGAGYSEAARVDGLGFSRYVPEKKNEDNHAGLLAFHCLMLYSLKHFPFLWGRKNVFFYCLGFEKGRW